MEPFEKARPFDVRGLVASTGLVLFFVTSVVAGFIAGVVWGFTAIAVASLVVSYLTGAE